MTKKEVINYVKTLIKSKTVLKEIEKRNNELEEMDILYFLEQYSKEYNTKIECYKSLKTIFKDEYALELLESLYDYEINIIKDFIKSAKDIIFEVIYEYEKRDESFSMIFTSYKDSLEFIKKVDDPLDPVSSLIRKRYINIDMKKCECISADMDVLGEVVISKNEILSAWNRNVSISYPWYEYSDGNKSHIRKQAGIIVGEYKPKICDIFNTDDIVKLKCNGVVNIGTLTDYRLGYNPCSIRIDNYKDIICKYEDLTKIEDDEEID